MNDRLDWNELIETALSMPGTVGDVYSRFHNYSFMNRLLLMIQGAEGPVATYDRWQSLGRQVLKGSKAKTIVRPIIIDKKNDAGEVEERRLRFKPVRCIFQLSDTEGEELPPAELPTWDLSTALTRLDIKQVPFESLDGNTQGYSREREFALNPLAVYPNKTMMHECAHIVCGHTVPEKLSQYVTHRGLCEFEAESSAYLVMHELGGLAEDDASESRAYLQNWLKGERPPEASIRKVFKATDMLLQAGRGIEQ